MIRTGSCFRPPPRLASFRDIRKQGSPPAQVHVVKRVGATLCCIRWGAACPRKRSSGAIGPLFAAGRGWDHGGRRCPVGWVLDAAVGMLVGETWASAEAG